MSDFCRLVANHLIETYSYSTTSGYLITHYKNYSGEPNMYWTFVILVNLPRSQMCLYKMAAILYLPLRNRTKNIQIWYGIRNPNYLGSGRIFSISILYMSGIQIPTMYSSFFYDEYFANPEFELRLFLISTYLSITSVIWKTC